MRPNTHGNTFNSSADSLCTIFRKAIKEGNVLDLTSMIHDKGMYLITPKLAVLDLAKMIRHRDTRFLMIYYNPTIAELADRLG